MSDRFTLIVDWVREHWEWLAGPGGLGALEAFRRWRRRRRLLQSTGGVDPDVHLKLAKVRQVSAETKLSEVRALVDTLEALAQDNGRLRTMQGEQAEHIDELRTGHRECEERYRQLHSNIHEVCTELKSQGCARIDQIHERVLEGLDDPVQ